MGLQKHLRGRLSREYFQNMRNGALVLQSYVRGENGRRMFDTKAKIHAVSVSEASAGELTAVTNLQSGILFAKLKILVVIFGIWCQGSSFICLFCSGSWVVGSEKIQQYAKTERTCRCDD